MGRRLGFWPTSAAEPRERCAANVAIIPHMPDSAPPKDAPAGRSTAPVPEGETSARPPKIPVSVLVVIHSPEGEVLLIERADRAGFWQSVTGSLDAVDEDLGAAAAREVWEETGIEVGSAQVPASSLVNWQCSQVYEIYPHWRHRYGPGVTHNTEHVFGLGVPRDMPVRLAPREHTAWAWLPWREAANRCFSPSNAAAIHQLAQRLGWATRLEGTACP
jgi:dATP pyrophosphohydrolase